MNTFKTVSDYIAALPAPAKERLRELRKMICHVAPEAEQAIRYNLPALKMNGSTLVWHAAFKKHIGPYRKASAIAAFQSELVAYKTSKGAVQFPAKSLFRPRSRKASRNSDSKRNECHCDAWATEKGAIVR